MTGNAVVAVWGVRLTLNRKRILRMGPPDGRRPRIGGVAVLARGRERIVPGEWAIVVVVLVTAHAQGWGAYVDRRISDMTSCASECFVRAVQRPRVHEGGRRPGVVAVAGAARVRKAFVRRIEGVLNIVHMADDAVGAANLYDRVVLRAPSARRREQCSPQGSDSQEPSRQSTKNQHEFQPKRSTQSQSLRESADFTGFSILTWRG